MRRELHTHVARDLFVDFVKQKTYVDRVNIDDGCVGAMAGSFRLAK